MAKATSIANLSGKINNLVFYRVEGKTYVRTKRDYFSDQVKTDAAFAAARKRTQFLKLSNAFTTAIYRMAKAEADRVNYKSHNQLMSLIFQVVSLNEKGKLDYPAIHKNLKGLSLNFLDTQPPVSIHRYEDDVLIGCDTRLEENASIKLLIGTLPKVRKQKDEFIADVNMREVEIVELMITPEDHLQNLRVPLGLAPNQAVVAIVENTMDEVFREWVRVV